MSSIDDTKPRSSARRFATPLLALVLLTARPIRAQDPPKPQPPLTFGATTELVHVGFHVARGKGVFVRDLKPDQIRVFEDGRPQTIAILETPSTTTRTVPAQVTLALDVSSSVLDSRLLDEVLVKEVFLATLSQDAKVGMCAFGGELKCTTSPTRDSAALLRGLEEALFFGRDTRRSGTRLYDSIADICRTLSVEKTQRAIVVFSDGIDNKDGKVTDAIAAAAENGVRVYAIKVAKAYQATGANQFGGFGSSNRALYDYRKLDLDRLAEETGGQAFEPGNLDRKRLAEILTQIATEVTMENVVGYQPEGPPTGKKRKVRVELVDKSIGTIRDGERTIVR